MVFSSWYWSFFLCGQRYLTVNLSTISVAIGCKYYLLSIIYYFQAVQSLKVRNRYISFPVDMWWWWWLAFICYVHKQETNFCYLFFIRFLRRQLSITKGFFLAGFISMLCRSFGWRPHALWLGRTASKCGPCDSYFCPSGLLYTGASLCLKTRKLISYFLPFFGNSG